ncbi:hypothetical protein SAMN05216174_12457 [Actinokineospora iranica]|uniref:Uncharacterized protein n=2 Tax=Actinokineospora iranica TaxID=1271860 RepID=A0A1G6Z1L4_9PSEU|nr:hypothetical protein SAMN05216174_12457 [Actinokineospora iranica]
MFSVAVAALVCALAPAVAAAQEAPAPPSAVETSMLQEDVYLGVIDLQAYCQHFYGGDIFLKDARSAYGWECHYNVNERIPINMYAACQLQYREPWARAGFSDRRNAYSWFCYLSPR